MVPPGSVHGWYQESAGAAASYSSRCAWARWMASTPCIYLVVVEQTAQDERAVVRTAPPSTSLVSSDARSRDSCPSRPGTDRRRSGGHGARACDTNERAARPRRSISSISTSDERRARFTAASRSSASTSRPSSSRRADRGPRRRDIDRGSRREPRRFAVGATGRAHASASIPWTGGPSPPVSGGGYRRPSGVKQGHRPHWPRRRSGATKRVQRPYSSHRIECTLEEPIGSRRAPRWTTGDGGP